MKKGDIVKYKSSNNRTRYQVVTMDNTCAVLKHTKTGVTYYLPADKYGRLMVTKSHKSLTPQHGIKEIIINYPATIVIFEDGTKTVSKCGERDTFDAEKGVALCIAKKSTGLSNSGFKKLVHTAKIQYGKDTYHANSDSKKN